MAIIMTNFNELEHDLMLFLEGNLPLVTMKIKAKPKQKKQKRRGYLVSSKSKDWVQTSHISKRARRSL